MSDAGHAPAGPAVAGSGLSVDERAELQRLRAEVSKMHTERAGPARRSHIGRRSPVALILIVVGCLLAPVSVLAVWTANEVSSTSRYVANVEPLVPRSGRPGCAHRQDHDRDNHPPQRDRVPDQAAALPDQPRTAARGGTAPDVRSVDQQRGRRVHPRPGAQDSDQPAVRSSLGPRPTPLSTRNWSRRSPGRAAVRSASATGRSSSASARSSTSSSRTWSNAASPSSASSRPSTRR